MSAAGTVAVIVPAHNAADMLPTALESVQQQTRPPQVIVVIDDGSTDDTAAVAERFGVRLIRQEQRGPGAARNQGLHAVDTEFVAFLDADDWYEPGKLEKSVELLQQLAAACMATEAWHVIGDRVERCKNDGRNVPNVLTKELLITGNPIATSTVVARRQAVLDAGGFDDDPELVPAENYDMWLRLSQREPIAYFGEPLSFFREHAGNFSNANVRYVRGVDRILAKIAAMHGSEAHFAQLIRKRRATVRIEAARAMLREGRRDEARDLVAEARQLSPSWRTYRHWLRSRLPGWSAS